MRPIKSIVFFSALSLLIAGCGRKRSAEDISPAGSSSLTMDQAKFMASIVALSMQPRGYVSTVAPTGSMAPVIDSRSVLILEKYIGQKLNVADIVCFDRGDAPNVCHRIVEIKDDAFYVSGDNNKWPDGWFKLSVIKHRVAGIIYSQR